MDVLIIPEARRAIATLLALRPKAGTWGPVIGHRRGDRFIVERVLAGGVPGGVPDGRHLRELEQVWPGRIIGLAVVRPGAAFGQAVRGPAWYGKIVLRAAGPPESPVLRAHVVEFDRRFRLDAVPLAPAAKEGSHE